MDIENIDLPVEQGQSKNIRGAGLDKEQLGYLEEFDDLPIVEGPSLERSVGEDSVVYSTGSDDVESPFAALALNTANHRLVRSQQQNGKRLSRNPRPVVNLAALAMDVGSNGLILPDITIVDGYQTYAFDNLVAEARELEKSGDKPFRLAIAKAVILEKFLNEFDTEDDDLLVQSFPDSIRKLREVRDEFALAHKAEEVKKLDEIIHATEVKYTALRIIRDPNTKSIINIPKLVSAGEDNDTQVLNPEYQAYRDIIISILNDAKHLPNPNEYGNVVLEALDRLTL